MPGETIALASEAKKQGKLFLVVEARMPLDKVLERAPRGSATDLEHYVGPTHTAKLTLPDGTQLASGAFYCGGLEQPHFTTGKTNMYFVGSREGELCTVCFAFVVKPEEVEKGGLGLSYGDLSLLPLTEETHTRK
jgi:hypothetical protein